MEANRPNLLRRSRRATHLGLGYVLALKLAPRGGPAEPVEDPDHLGGGPAGAVPRRPSGREYEQPQ